MTDEADFLSDLEVDALTEIVNIGVSRAAASLRQMVGRPVVLSVPSIEVTTGRTAAALMAEREVGPLVAVAQDFMGAFAGRAMLIFPETNSLALARAVTGEDFSEADLADVVDLEEEALKETGNVVLTNCLATMANILQRPLDMSIPTVLREDGVELFVRGGEAAGSGGVVLFLYINFAISDRDIRGYIAVLMDVPSLDALRGVVADFIGRVIGEPDVLRGMSEITDSAFPVGGPPQPGGAGVWTWDMTNGRLRGDDRFARLYGVEPADAELGLPSEIFFRGVHPDDALRLRIAVAGVEHGVEVFNRDYRLVGRQGVRWVSARGRAEHDELGRATRFSGVLIDISEQKRVEERLRIAQTAGGVGTFEYVEGFGTVTVSDQFCRLLGLHVAEALPVRTINGLVRAEDPPLIAAQLGRSARQSELRILRADNKEERWLAVRGELRPDDETAGRRFIGVIYDITESKRAEHKLRELTRTLEARVEARTQERDRLWNASRDLFAVIGLDGRQRSINPAWSRMLGYGEDELLGGQVGQLLHPDDLGLVREAWPRADGAAAHFDARLKCQNGDWRWIDWTVIPLGDAYYAVGRDVTERKSLEDQLRQSQKMEAVGQLTGGLAHDFNNMLTGIMGSLDMLSRRIADGRLADAQRFMDSASAAAARAAALTHRLLAFSRRQALDPRSLDVNALVSSMLDLLSRTLGEQVKLSVALAPDVWPALTDENQLENAVLNLAINARDAMPNGGELTLETRNCTGPAGDYVALRVRDTGVGMTPEVLERVFDPFFTTKPLGQGTGLGLSMVYGFMRQTGGEVRIDSRPQVGTTVELRLPRATEAVSAAPDEAAAAPAGSGETVLVVEDDESVRLVVVELLDELGYQAIEVAAADEALEVLASDRRVDLLVTDVGLPGLNGRQLADIAREHRPGLPVLFMTGYAAAAAAARRSEFLGPGMEMIPKPFALDALAVKIKQMVAR